MKRIAVMFLNTRREGRKKADEMRNQEAGEEEDSYEDRQEEKVAFASARFQRASRKRGPSFF
jgi:hypothetical protein